MKIQSLSVCVPAKKCINNCKFCVSNMHKSKYENMLDINNLYWDLYEQDYKDRLMFARDNGCNTVMLTGDCEPQQNREFLKMFGTINKSIDKPFRKIEMQTTGTLLNNDYLYFLRHHVGVSTISLSVSSFIMDNNTNWCEMKNPINLPELCKAIKKYRFNLRLSLNLTKDFEIDVRELFKQCLELGADQLTFRVLYNSDLDTDQDKWINENKASDSLILSIRNYITIRGRQLERLEFGLTKYSVDGMSVVLDDDCMSTEAKEELKYLILRENCKLYSKWDDKGSLIF